MLKPRFVEREVSGHSSFLQQSARAPNDESVGVLLAPDGIPYRIVPMRHGVHDSLVDRNERELRQLLEPAFRSSLQVGLEEPGFFQEGTKIPNLFGDRTIKGFVEAGRRPALLTIQRNIEAKHADVCLRQLALRTRVEEQSSGIREAPVAGHGSDVAEQIMNRPFVRGGVEKHLPEFFDDTGVELALDIFRAWRPFEVDDALVPLDLFPLQAR